MDSHFIPGWTLVYEQSFHARVVWSMDSHFMPGWSGLWAGLIPCQDGLWPMSRVRFMPGWSLLYEQGFFSCQGGLWSMDRVRFMPGLSGLRTGFDVRFVPEWSMDRVMSCQGGLWSMGSVHFMPGLSLDYRQGSFHARVVYGQCHVMPGWFMGSVTCHARVVYGQGVRVMPGWSKGQCHFMPEWSLVSGHSSFYARFVYRLFCCFRVLSNILKT